VSSESLIREVGVSNESLTRVGQKFDLLFLRNFLTQKVDKEGLNLFVTGKFFHVRELQSLQGAESNSPR